MAEDVGIEGERRTEGIGLHIAQDAMAELAGYDAVVEVVLDVQGCKYQAAAEDVGFEEHSELAGEMPGVDGLYDGLVVSGELGEVHALGTIGKLPPLEVLPVIGREVVEDGVRGLDIGACGVWRFHLEP